MPALGVGILIIMGVLLGTTLPPLARDAALALAVLLLLGATMSARWLHLRGAALAAAFACIGASLGVDVIRFGNPSDIARFAAIDGTLVRLRLGPLQEIEARGEFGAGLTAIAPVEQIDGLSATGWIRLRVDRAAHEMFAGGRWDMLGLLRSETPPLFTGARDAALADRAQGISAEFRVESASTADHLSIASANPLARWRAWARASLCRGAPDSVDFALLRSLTLADDDVRLRGVREDFQRTGTAHHLAVSGTHLAFVAAGIYILCRLTAASRWGRALTPRRTVLLTLAIVTAYGLAVAPSAALVRSLMLAVLLSVGLLLDRRILAANLLGACAVIMVMIAPGVVLSAGFQLTFFVLLALLVVTPPLRAHLATYRDPDFAVADAWRPATRGAARRRLKWRLLTSAATALTAFLAAAPLVSHHFAQLNPYTALAGILLEPFVILALFAGLAKITLSALLPWASHALAFPATGAAGLLRWAVHAMAQAPGTSLPSRHEPALLSIALASLLFLPLMIRRRYWKSFVWCAAAALILWTPLALDRLRSAPSGLRITILPTHPPHVRLPSVLIAVDAEPPVLVDPPDDEEAFRRTVDPLLTELGIRHIGRVLFTRPDTDHVAAVNLLHKSYDVDEIQTQSRDLGIAHLDFITPRPDLPGQTRVALRVIYHGRTLYLAEALDRTSLTALSRDPGATLADAIVLPRGLNGTAFSSVRTLPTGPTQLSTFAVHPTGLAEFGVPPVP